MFSEFQHINSAHQAEKRRINGLKMKENGTPKNDETPDFTGVSDSYPCRD